MRAVQGREWTEEERGNYIARVMERVTAMGINMWAKGTAGIVRAFLKPGSGGWKKDPGSQGADLGTVGLHDDPVSVQGYGHVGHGGHVDSDAGQSLHKPIIILDLNLIDKLRSVP